REKRRRGRSAGSDAPEKIKDARSPTAAPAQATSNGQPGSTTKLWWFFMDLHLRRIRGEIGRSDERVKDETMTQPPWKPAPLESRTVARLARTARTLRILEARLL